MRGLIDTNILIYREGKKEVDQNLQSLMRIGSECGTVFLIHPLSKQEIGQLKDEKQRIVEVSKVHSYPLLDSPPSPTDKSFSSIIPTTTNKNEMVDNSLLCAVYKGAVDFLITEDRKIHSKAQKLNLADKVLTINAALGSFL